MTFIEIGNNRKRPKLVVEGIMNLVFDGGNFEYLIGKGYSLRKKRKNFGRNFENGRKQKMSLQRWSMK